MTTTDQIAHISKLESLPFHNGRVEMISVVKLYYNLTCCSCLSSSSCSLIFFCCLVILVSLSFSFTRSFLMMLLCCSCCFDSFSPKINTQSANLGPVKNRCEDDTQFVHTRLYQHQSMHAFLSPNKSFAITLKAWWSHFSIHSLHLSKYKSSCCCPTMRDLWLTLRGFTQFQLFLIVISWSHNPKSCRLFIQHLMCYLSNFV